MKAAILGDIVGSAYESRHVEPPRSGFPLFRPGCGFTDDTLMTVAVMDALLSGVGGLSEAEARAVYRRTYHEYGNRYPGAGYGGFFRAWLAGDGSAVGTSYGNGAMMRVSPVAWFFDDLDEVLLQAERTTLATHEHEESRRAVRAVAGAILLARRGSSKVDIRDWVESGYGYDLSRSLQDLKARREFQVTCMGTVPVVFAAFFEGDGVEDTIRRAIQVGGDTDTNACIAGSLAEGMCGGVPDALWAEAAGYLDRPLRETVERFLRRVAPSSGR